ncbi:hypothetical protein [Pseudonocardia zijingensis]|uniref:Uncharacterized protein n=1 Tax=Pseudonocardia zijingensis TaxID=153376 RepID=A0ABN1P5G4_9PSEU
MRDTATQDRRATDRELPGERAGRSEVPDPPGNDVERALAALYGDDDDVGEPPRDRGREAIEGLIAR